MSVLTLSTRTHKLIYCGLKVLKPACMSALRRIFKLCDANKDGILDPAELNEFQVRVPSKRHKCYEAYGFSENVSTRHYRYKS